METLHVPQTTLIAAGLLGIVLLVLSVRVIVLRGKTKVMLGDGQGSAQALFVAARSHANFIEYVPLILLLTGGIEVLQGPTLSVKILAYGLVAARVMHPLGMGVPAPNPMRAGGAVLTLGILGWSSIALLLAVLGH